MKVIYNDKEERFGHGNQKRKFTVADIREVFALDWSIEPDAHSYVNGRQATDDECVSGTDSIEFKDRYHDIYIPKTTQRKCLRSIDEEWDA